MMNDVTLPLTADRHLKYCHEIDYNLGFEGVVLETCHYIYIELNILNCYGLARPHIFKVGNAIFRSWAGPQQARSIIESNLLTSQEVTPNTGWLTARTASLAEELR